MPSKLGTSKASAAVLCLINEQRQTHGLKGVRASGKLRSAARRLASQMVVRHFFAHVALSGRTARYRAGAKTWRLGETLAWGAGRGSTPAALVRSLMNSPPHRAIILDGGFRDAGVGLVQRTPYGTAGATLVIDFGLAVR